MSVGLCRVSKRVYFVYVAALDAVYVILNRRSKHGEGDR